MNKGEAQNVDDDHERRNDDMFLGLLDLPRGTSLSFDGMIPMVLKRDDFLGFSNVPTTTTTSSFHLITIRRTPSSSSSSSSSSQDHHGNMSMPHGLILFRKSSSSTKAPPVVDDRDPSTHGKSILRRYDPLTEEITAEPVDPITTQNLMQAMEQSSRRRTQIDPHRIIPFPQLVQYHQQQQQQSQTQQRQEQQEQQLLIQSNIGHVDDPIVSWQRLTGFISTDLLELRGLVVDAASSSSTNGLSSVKIVPSIYDDDNHVPTDGDETRNKSGEADGISVTYPPIPCLFRTKYRNHRGTKAYLSQLSPQERTRLFGLSDHPGLDVLHHCLELYYYSKTTTTRIQLFLGDLQLSFLLFYHLQCFSSFEHWRDCIGMLSYVEAIAKPEMVQLYEGVLSVLHDQIRLCMMDAQRRRTNQDQVPLVLLMEDIMDFASPGRNNGNEHGTNVLTESLRRIIQLCQGQQPSSDITRLVALANALEPFVSTTMGKHSEEEDDNNDNDSDLEYDDAFRHDKQGRTSNPQHQTQAETNATVGMPMLDFDDDDDDDDDGPVIVPLEEVENVLLQQHNQHDRYRNDIDNNNNEGWAQQFPFLAANMRASNTNNNKEDVLMACSRILDEQKDVTLVREAAAYLEQIEAFRIVE